MTELPQTSPLFLGPAAGPGAGAVWTAEPLMPWIPGLAAGTMCFVTGNEIIPETHRRGHAHAATFALLGGLVLMMGLDATLA